MKRRNFLKLMALSPFAGLAVPRTEHIKANTTFVSHCNICRNTGRVWSVSNGYNDEYVQYTKYSVRSCDCPAGMARERILKAA